MANYRNLMVWQNSRKLVKQIYDLTGKFPLEEKFGLANQIQRAADQYHLILQKGMEGIPIKK